MSTESEQRSIVTKIASSATEQEKAALLKWAQALLQIRSSSLTPTQKAKEALHLTSHSKIVWPATKIVGREIKRLGWDDRGAKSRFGIVGAGIGAVLFGSQGAGIAALGTAIGVPLWVVLGGGGIFAGMLVEELSKLRTNSSNAIKSAEKIITENDCIDVDAKHKD